MAIKLVVSDLDGTLLNRTSRLDSNTVRAVKSLNEEGILFTFATGRIDLNTWHFAKQLNLQLPIISCNGALIRYPFTGEPFMKHICQMRRLMRFYGFFNQKREIFSSIRRLRFIILITAWR